MVVRKVEAVGVRLLTTSTDESNEKLMLGTSAACMLEFLSLFSCITLKHCHHEVISSLLAV